ncbi:MAG: HAD family phosphatase [Clostridia bacterium]|nr:HAD family phosphatase [Clostridia bacterium]
MDTTKTCYLFFDLDGTVLNHNYELTKENLDAMLKARSLGHKLILNTGRSRGGYLLKNADAARVIPWDGTCFSSADITFEGNLLYENAVSKSDFEIWLEYCMEHRLDMSYCGREEQVLWEFGKYSEPMTEEQKNEWRKKSKIAFEQNILTNISIMGILDEETLPETGLSVYQLPTYADLFPAGCNKGSVVRTFCDKLGVSLEQCVGFGDSNNDVDMLIICPTGVCMLKSPQALIDVATYHAKTENGVAEGLHYLFGV